MAFIIIIYFISEKRILTGPHRKVACGDPGVLEQMCEVYLKDNKSTIVIEEHLKKVYLETQLNFLFIPYQSILFINHIDTFLLK